MEELNMDYSYLSYKIKAKCDTIKDFCDRYNWHYTSFSAKLCNKRAFTYADIVLLQKQLDLDEFETYQSFFTVMNVENLSTQRKEQN